MGEHLASLLAACVHAAVTQLLRSSVPRLPSWKLVRSSLGPAAPPSLFSHSLARSLTHSLTHSLSLSLSLSPFLLVRFARSLELARAVLRYFDIARFPFSLSLSPRSSSGDRSSPPSQRVSKSWRHSGTQSHSTRTLFHVERANARLPTTTTPRALIRRRAFEQLR